MFDLTTLRNIVQYSNPATTQFIEIPRGLREWRIFTSDPVNPLVEPASIAAHKINTLTIQLYPTFGMMVGYDPELDILVFWK